MFLTDILRLHLYGIPMVWCRIVIADAFQQLLSLHIRMQTNLAVVGVYVNDIKTETEPDNNKKKECKSVRFFPRTVCFQMIFPFRFFYHTIFNFSYPTVLQVVSCRVFPKKIWFLSVLVIYFREKNISKERSSFVCVYVHVYAPMLI